MSSDKTDHERFRFILRGRMLAAALVCMVLSLGCSGDKGDVDTESAPANKVTVRVLFVDDDSLAETVERLWAAEDRGKLEVSHLTSAEFSKATKRPEADVVIYPSTMVGDMMQRNVVAPLPEHVTKNASYQRSDVFSLDRLATASWGDQAIGFSLGSPQFVLLYRSDVFEQLSLMPPTSWEEYAQTVAALNTYRSQNEDVEWHAVAEPLAGRWAGRLMLLRAASYVKHQSRYSDLFDLATMEPLIGTPPFVRALSEMKRVLENDYATLSELGSDGVSDLVFSGECAMAITVLRPSDSREFPESSISDKVGLTRVPGSTEVFSFGRGNWEPRNARAPTSVPLLGVDGRVASVIYLSRRTAAAQEFLLWIAGPDSSGKVLPRSIHVAPFRKSHCSKIARWVDPRLGEEASGDYAIQIEQALQQTLWMTEPRLPGSQDYSLALDAAVTSVFADTVEPEDALSHAATKWRELNTQFGKSEQKAAYEASLQLK